ncbi:zf-HC2 domain-containing protein [Magnetococcus sp. PR-3]|uniref:zf-HC2 domain-containing protein n=1 Tax=Magnetococcus sp. PR-3 TaxID=3120355 RepID=UPI003FA55DB7
MLSCKATTQLLSEKQDRPLSGWEKLNLKVHLWMCRGCTNFGQQLSTLQQIHTRIRQGKNLTG